VKKKRRKRKRKGGRNRHLSEFAEFFVAQRINHNNRTFKTQFDIATPPSWHISNIIVINNNIGNNTN